MRTSRSSSTQSRKRGRWVFDALPSAISPTTILILIAIVFTSQPAAAQESYWIGRIDGTDHVFDQRIPDDFGKDVLAAANNDAFLVDDAPAGFAPKTVGGVTYRFAKVAIQLKDGKSFFAINWDTQRGKGGSLTSLDLYPGTPEGQNLAREIPKGPQGKFNQGHEILFLIAPNATKPDVRISIYGASTRYWLGRVNGDSYVFDVPIPEDTGKALVEANPAARLTHDPSVEFPAQSADGTRYKVSSVPVTYDHEMFVKRGEVAVPQKGGNKWIKTHRGATVGNRFTGALDALGQPRLGGPWKSMNLMILASSGDQKTPLRLPAAPFCEPAGEPDSFGSRGENNVLATYGEQPQILGHYQNGQLAIAWQKHGSRKSVKLTSYKNGGNGFTKQWTKDVPRGIERLAGFVGDGTDLYCMTSNSERLEYDPSVQKVARGRVLNLVKMNSNGDFVWEADLGQDTSYHTEVDPANPGKADRGTYFVYSPMVAGTGDLAAGDGKIAVMCAVNTEPDFKLPNPKIPGTRGRRHQTAFRLTVNSSDGKPATIGRQYSWAHSFDQRVIFDGTDFVCLSQPDQGTYMAGGGIEITKMLNQSNSHASIAKGWYVYIRSGQDNYSSINMTDFAAGPNGYVVPFVAQKGPHHTTDRDSRNVGFLHVVKNFDSLPVNTKDKMSIRVDSKLVDTKTKNSNASGDVPGPSQVYGTSNGGKFAYTGVAWLTDYKVAGGITAACPKLFKFADNKYLIMFEEWGIKRASNGDLSATSSYQTTKAMLVDEYGNVLKPTTDLGILPLRHRDSLFDVDGNAAWVYFDVAAYQFRLCTIDENLQRTCHPLDFSDDLTSSPSQLASTSRPTKPGTPSTPTIAKNTSNSTTSPTASPQPMKPGSKPTGQPGNPGNSGLAKANPSPGPMNPGTANEGPRFSTGKKMTPESMAAVIAKVADPASGDYTMIYDANLRKLGPNLAYTVDNSDSFSGKFDRVGYLLELNSTPANGGSVFENYKQTVLVTMKAFTSDVKKLSIPTTNAGIHSQQPVESMDVYSTVDGLNGTRINGRIEFWPNDYLPGPDGIFNGQDAPNGGKNGYGSMQVHNADRGTTVFAFNGWRDGDLADVGIGESSISAHGQVNKDWTFANNLGNYTSARLRIFVRTGKSDLVSIAAKPAGDPNNSGNMRDSSSNPVSTVARVEAEDAAFTGKAVASDIHTGFEGKGFAHHIFKGSSIEMKPSVPTAGLYNLKIRYATPDPQRTMSLHVNNDFARQVAFTKTGSWQDWAYTATPVNLKAGENTIRLSAGEADSDTVNIDYIAVSPANVSIPTPTKSAKMGGKGPFYIITAQAYTHPENKNYASDICRSHEEATRSLKNNVPVKYRDYLQYNTGSLQKFETYEEAVKAQKGL